MKNVRNIISDEDFPYQLLKKRFHANRFFMSIVLNKLNNLGDCVYKRNRFSKVIINTMNEIGRSEISNEDFVSFVSKIFNEINSIPDQGPLKSFSSPSSASKGSDYERSREYVNTNPKTFPLPHSVRQQVVKHVDYIYLKQMDTILKDIRSAHHESEANLISICESVGFMIEKFKESNTPIECFRTFVYNRYNKLKEKRYWYIDGRQKQ